MKKTIIALLLVVVMCASLCACGGNGGGEGGEGGGAAGAVQQVGNFSIFVPDGWESKIGDLLDENDPNKCKLNEKDATFNYISAAIYDNEDTVDMSIETTKEINEGSEDVTKKIGDIEWTGVKYESLGYKCVVLKGVVSADKVYYYNSVGYDLDGEIVTAVLESLK